MVPQLGICFIMSTIIRNAGALLKDENRLIPCFIAAGITIIINLAIQLTAYIKARNRPQGPDFSDPKFFSYETFAFLFPPRQTKFEVFWVVLIGGLYGGLATYVFHPTTVFKITGYHENLLAENCILTVGVLCSYSLFSLPIPESAPYMSSEGFHILSYHY